MEPEGGGTVESDLIRRGDVLHALKQVFDRHNVMFGGNAGGFSSEVPAAIEGIPATCVMQERKPVAPMRYEIHYADGTHKSVHGRNGLLKLLQESGHTAITDIRKRYKSGVSDSVMEKYEKYINS